MINCEQTSGVNMVQHGQHVLEKAKKLIIGDFNGFKLPQWFIDNHHFIVNNLHKFESIKLYTLYHDCGKPRCKTVDRDGKVHFPDHANVSKFVFSQHFNDPVAEELIGLDMLLHTETVENVLAKELDVKTYMTLLLVAFAEIHANAEMFGGQNSTSFKIKFKKLERIGRQLIKNVEKHAEMWLYIFVRSDMNPSHIVVQAGHAVYEQVKHDPQRHPSFVVLNVDSVEDFSAIAEKLFDNNIQYKMFREPMPPYNGDITAIATEPLGNDRRHLLKEFKLLNL